MAVYMGHQFGVREPMALGASMWMDVSECPRVCMCVSVAVGRLAAQKGEWVAVSVRVARKASA